MQNILLIRICWSGSCKILPFPLTLFPVLANPTVLWNSWQAPLPQQASCSELIPESSSFHRVKQTCFQPVRPFNARFLQFRKKSGKIRCHKRQFTFWWSKKRRSGFFLTCEQRSLLLAGNSFFLFFLAQFSRRNNMFAPSINRVFLFNNNCRNSSSLIG